MIEISGHLGRCQDCSFAGMIKSSLLFILLTATSLPVSAQLISLGIKGGASLLEPASRNDESRRYIVDESRRYIVGPSVEVPLPGGFALEADALYQRIGNTSTSTLTTITSAVVSVTQINKQRGNSWEFPVLGKYYLKHASRWQPFAAAGFSLRTIGIEAEDTTNTPATVFTPPSVTNFKSNYRSELGLGAVFAGGLRYKVGRLSVMPEIRYSRWGSNDSLSNRNAVTAFLGLSL